MLWAVGCGLWAVDFFFILSISFIHSRRRPLSCYLINSQLIALTSLFNSRSSLVVLINNTKIATNISHRPLQSSHRLSHPISFLFFLSRGVSAISTCDVLFPTLRTRLYNQPRTNPERTTRTTRTRTRTEE